MSSRENKENLSSKKVTSVRKSLGHNTSFNSKLTEKEDINELNNQFTDYIDYVRKIEASNEKLRNEKQGIIESFEIEINNIKATYGNEIDSLRKALDDVTTSKATLTIENKVLSEEKDKLHTKCRNETNALIVLKKEYSELEENLSNYRRKFDNYESLKLDYNELQNEHDKILKELKNTLFKHAELESRYITLKDEMEFHKKVSDNKSTFDVHAFNVQDSNVSKIDRRAEEIATIKEELTEEFKQYKENLENVYNEKFANLSKMNEKSTAKCNSLYHELKTSKLNAEKLYNELLEKDNKIDFLNKLVSTNKESLKKIMADHENYVKDIVEENANYKKELEAKIHEISTVIDEKIAVEKELYMFRSLLEGEQSRCNIGDVSSPKKRRKASFDDFDIKAWSNNKVKLFCNEKYDGSYIQMLNDTINDQNINEWKVEISSNGEMATYKFPVRELKAGCGLKLWKQGQGITEDDDNVVMNIDLPIADQVTCKLLNDMDEPEAYFELRKISGARKILKAKKKNVDKEGCYIM